MSTIGYNSPLKEREMSSEKELIHFEDASPSLQSKTTPIKCEFSQGDMLCAEGGSNEDQDQPCFFDFLDNILSRMKFQSEYTEREGTNIGIPGPMHSSRRVFSTKSRKGDLKKHFDLDRNSLSLDDATPLLQECNSQEIFMGLDKSYDSIQSMALMRVEEPGEDSDYSYSITKDSHVDCSTTLNWNCLEPNATEACFQCNRLDRKALDDEGLLFYESLADDEASSFSSDCLEDFSPPPIREDWADDLEDSLDNIDNSSDEDYKTDDSMTSEGPYKKLVEFSDEDEEASSGESSSDGSSCSKSSIEKSSSLSEYSTDGSESSSGSTDGSESLRGSSDGSENSSGSTDGSENSSGSTDGSESSSGSSGDESTSTSKSKTCESSVSEYSTSEEELLSSCEFSKGELQSLILSDSETDDSTKPLNVCSEMYGCSIVFRRILEQTFRDQAFP